MLKIGEVVTGHVYKIEEYGIYLKYHEYDIFVKIIDLDWNIESLEPFKFTKIADEMKVKILRFVKNNQYLGSIKDVYPDKNPWRDSSLYPIGKRFYGYVSSIVDYGYFIKLDTGNYGLILKEDVKYLLKIGDIVHVVIIEANVKKKRIGLKLINDI